MDWIIQFFGRFHPMLVHFPIGILFLAFLFECFSQFKAYKKLRSAIQPALFLGALFAVASVASGYSLSLEGGYDDSLLETHQNMGIATAVVAIMLYFLRLKLVRYFRDNANRKLIRIILFLPLIILLSITGHFGGSMTHGEDYLFEFIAGSPEEVPDPAVKLQTIGDINEAVLYPDIIQPILNSRCYSCHSSRKQKGELRLDGIGFIKQGGKHGAIIEVGTPDSSLLYSRLMLPLEDEHHMPPNEKPQPSSSEIALVQVWIEGGASFEKKVVEYSHADKIKTYFHSLVDQIQKENLIPEEEVAAADINILTQLKAKGVMVLPLSVETNYLSASFVNKRSVSEEDLRLLVSLKDQLLWLNLARTSVSDSAMNIVAQLSALRKLNLDYTEITDVGIKPLSSLSDLHYLNLVGTKITDQGLLNLTALKNLKSIFIYQTAVNASGVRNFKAASPSVSIDTGRYQLPKLLTDSIVAKVKPS